MLSFEAAAGLAAKGSEVDADCCPANGSTEGVGAGAEGFAGLGEGTRSLLPQGQETVLPACSLAAFSIFAHFGHWNCITTFSPNHVITRVNHGRHVATLVSAPPNKNLNCRDCTPFFDRCRKRPFCPVRTDFRSLNKSRSTSVSTSI